MCFSIMTFGFGLSSSGDASDGAVGKEEAVWCLKESPQLHQPWLHRTSCPRGPLRKSFSWLTGIPMPGGLGGLPSKQGHSEESLQDACLCCHREQPAGHPSSHKASSCPRRCPHPSLPCRSVCGCSHQHTPPKWLICHC